MTRMTNKEFKQLLTEWRKNISESYGDEANPSLDKTEGKKLKSEREKLDYIEEHGKSMSGDVREVLIALSQDESSLVRCAAASTMRLPTEDLAKYFGDKRNEARELNEAFKSIYHHMTTAMLEAIYEAVGDNVGKMANVFASHENSSEKILADLFKKFNSNSIVLRKIKFNRNCPSNLKKDIVKKLKVK